MRIKSFEQWTGQLNEDRGYYGDQEGYRGEGKTAFSKWLRRVNNRMKYHIDDIKISGRDSAFGKYQDTYQYSRSAAETLPKLTRLITGAAAAIADFFTPSLKSQKSAKEKTKKSKDEILDDWQRKEIGDKKVSDTDAENFYRSGVLKGKKYFGDKYNPTTPQNRDEEQYSDYLNSAMKRYYDKIYTGRK